jgi:hypothetical protein
MEKVTALRGDPQHCWRMLLDRVTMVLHIVCLLTQGDLRAFVFPITIYAIFATLKESVKNNNSNIALPVLFRLT